MANLYLPHGSYQSPTEHVRGNGERFTLFDRLQDGLDGGHADAHVRQVGLHGGCPAAAVPDAGDDRRGILYPMVAVCLRGSAIVWVIDSQERAQDCGPAPGQGLSVTVRLPAAVEPS